MSNEPFTISAVVPVYGCRDCLEELCVQLERNLSILTDQYEIILVDDRSPDNWWQILPELQKRHASLKAVRLSRNYGQQVAITAGLAAAKGDYTVVMDCDLQDPPDLIPTLFAKLREGHDLVLARRVSRSHSPFRQLAARIFVAISRMLTNEKIDGSYGSFSLLSRKVVDSFLLFEERERYYLSIIRCLGFNVGTVDFLHRSRHSGSSSYGLRHLFRIGINGILLQATVALHWIVGFGFFIAISGTATAAYLVWRQLFQASIPGWTSLIVLMLLCTGVILISLGFVGLYIGKIFEQTRGRPLYVVDSVEERRLSW
ncbi:glycosyl transferase family 2 [Parvibaculum lavamentivorans DS-1]|uniref:Glycosyl transferase family 2 n=1 Tax=Parvibaculum lavamentivorans (strain DS-1 / DSM 13023 / NCIMB 13966) TaxID=402881 RepID=A7HYD0_PARL1|nr:glycosyltransferase family 2 protein [Parvibaculum lavamentivorans]ABS64913.1 glycosyl transferase family 2 [Parvibaculum lavamentivorans DS-1]